MANVKTMYFETIKDVMNISGLDKETKEELINNRVRTVEDENGQLFILHYTGGLTKGQIAQLTVDEMCRLMGGGM